MSVFLSLSLSLSLPQRMEDVDHVPQSPLVKQRSVPTSLTGRVGGGGGGSEREKQLSEENSKLQAQVVALSKVSRRQTEIHGKTEPHSPHL